MMNNAVSTDTTAETSNYYPALDEILAAAQRLQSVVTRTPLIRSENLSERYAADIYLKREDQQLVRSYKIRGAYNKIVSLTAAQNSIA